MPPDANLPAPQHPTPPLGKEKNLQRTEKTVPLWLDPIGLAVMLVMLAYAGIVSLFASTLFVFESVVFIFSIIIIGVFGVASLSSLWVVNASRKDMSKLNALIASSEAEFEAVVTELEEADATVRSIRRVFKNKLDLEFSKASLIPKLVLGIIVRHQGNTPLEIHEILADEIDPYFELYNSRMDTLSGVCVALGLLGTFAGMLLAIGETVTLTVLLAGLKLAIGSSLAGIISGVAIQVIEQINATRERELRSQYKNFAMSRLFTPFQATVVLKISEKNARDIGDQIGKVMKVQLEDVYSRLTTALNKLDRSLMGMESRMKDHNRGLEQLVATLRENINQWYSKFDEMREMVADINKSFTQLEGNLGDLNGKIKTSSNLLLQSNKSFSKALDDLNESVVTINDSLDQWNKSEVADTLMTFSQSLGQSSEKLRAEIENLDKTFNDRLKTFIGQAAGHWARLDSSHNLHSEKLESFSGDLKRTGALLSSSSQGLKGIEIKLGKLIKEIEKKESPGMIAKIFNRSNDSSDGKESSNGKGSSTT